MKKVTTQHQNETAHRTNNIYNPKYHTRLYNPTPITTNLIVIIRSNVIRATKNNHNNKKQHKQKTEKKKNSHVIATSPLPRVLLPCYYHVITMLLPCYYHVITRYYRPQGPIPCSCDVFGCFLVCFCCMFGWFCIPGGLFFFISFVTYVTTSSEQIVATMTTLLRPLTQTQNNQLGTDSTLVYFSLRVARFCLANPIMIFNLSADFDAFSSALSTASGCMAELFGALPPPNTCDHRSLMSFTIA